MIRPSARVPALVDCLKLLETGKSHDDGEDRGLNYRPILTRSQSHW
jgi:hypothetical protein